MIIWVRQDVCLRVFACVTKDRNQMVGEGQAQLSLCMCRPEESGSVDYT